MDFIEDLNEEQQKAVTYNDGPELVIAGAGSGKTRVLTYKIAWLLSQGIPAGHILSLTFTNKAANEMKQRIARLVGEDMARYLWMGTFHSMCSRILRAEAEVLGYTNSFTIYDSADQKSLIRRIIKEMNLDEKVYRIGAVINRISTAKSEFVTPKAYAEDKSWERLDRMERLYQMAAIYAEYNNRLFAANAMDFDDLLMNVVILLQRYPDIRERYQQRFWHVLVDEYQDTNCTQGMIVKLLAAPQNNICVVGDDAQSIYSFRGATIENILGFQSDYPNAVLFKLERNYRSTQNIVNAANSLIHKNKEQIHKTVYSEKEQGDRLHITGYSNDKEESEAIVRQIVTLHRLRKRDYEDIAILYRTNAQSRTFEAEMRKLGIPYRIYGGMSFYERKEVKDAIAYFRIVVNMRDDESLMRIINVPKRGIGDTTMSRVRAAASQANVPITSILLTPEQYDTQVSAATSKKLQTFAEKLRTWIPLSTQLDAYTFATTILGASGLMTDAAADMTAEGIERKSNLEELLSAIHQFVEERTKQDASAQITDFLSEVSLLTDQDEHTDDTTARITLMTVHAAKGLEFPIVFVAGMEENLFPSPFCLSEREIEEERRLLYVAITRAEEQCWLTYATQRWRNGQVTFSNPSRFLRDIDHLYVAKMEGGEIMRRQEVPIHNIQRFVSATPQPTQSRLTQTTIRTNEEQNGKEPIQTEWHVGQRIAHKTFGIGTVKQAYRENGNDKIEIDFNTHGTKTLLLTYAKLSPA